MKRAMFLLAAFALLLAACAAKVEEMPADDYALYYAAALDENGGGDAISVSNISVKNGAVLDTQTLARLLVAELLRAPAADGLRSPFPDGTRLRELSIAGGRAIVDLSEDYASLSGIDLSIADYCVTLTLTQLGGVNAVRITANGRELPYRQTQLLTAADPLFSSYEDVIRPINVSLWFLDAGTGELRAEQQTLALYEGQTRVSAVLDALIRGPEGDGALRPLLTEEFAALSSRIEDGVCYVNLNENVPLPEDEALRALAYESLARSLTSLSGVDDVQLLLDGEVAYETAFAALAAESEETES